LLKFVVSFCAITDSIVPLETVLFFLELSCQHYCNQLTFHLLLWSTRDISWKHSIHRVSYCSFFDLYAGKFEVVYRL